MDLVWHGETFKIKEKSDRNYTLAAGGEKRFQHQSGDDVNSYTNKLQLYTSALVVGALSAAR